LAVSSLCWSRSPRNPQNKGEFWGAGGSEREAPGNITSGAGRVPQPARRPETPSWAYGNSGTRFKVFAQEGVPRDAFEKLDDAAQVHRLTGVAPSVALHIPWDKVDDYAKLAKHAADVGVRIGTINANLFQDPDYKLGSLTHPDRRVRAKALDHLFDCIEIMRLTGSKDLKLWFADGTNYPGQDSFRARQDRLGEGLAQAYERLGDDQRMLLEYKLFEPAFYHSDVPDWGTSLVHCVEIGEQAKVVVDTGHHAPALAVSCPLSLSGTRRDMSA